MKLRLDTLGCRVPHIFSLCAGHANPRYAAFRRVRGEEALTWGLGATPAAAYYACEAQLTTLGRRAAVVRGLTAARERERLRGVPLGGVDVDKGFAFPVMSWEDDPP